MFTMRYRHRRYLAAAGLSATIALLPACSVSTSTGGSKADAPASTFAGTASENSSATPSPSSSAASTAGPSPSSSSASDTATGQGYVVLRDTPMLKGPYADRAVHLGTFRKGGHVHLYCWHTGTEEQGTRGSSDVWFNESGGNWISFTDIDTGTTQPPVPECGSPKTEAASEQEITAFVRNNTGKTLTTWDDTSPGQCVSVVENFLDHYYGIILTGQFDAYTFAPGGVGGKQMEAANFGWHTDRNFKDGDIIVLDRDTPSAPGHVAMYYHGGLFESNVDGRMTAALDPMNDLPNYRGYWRATD